MLNILINAYAVSPNWGSEPGLGWNWVVNLAKYCNVFVITEGEWKSEITQAVQKLPQCNNIHFYYNPVSEEIRKMCWNQGDWRFYKHYRIWQEKTLEIAHEIIRQNRIDIIHQLNMIGFREPGSLWKIKNIPFVWGPVGGYGWTTLGYLNNQTLGIKAKALLKNILNYFQGKFYPLSNNAMKRADVVLAANSNVYRYIYNNKRKDVILMNETGCYEKNNQSLNHSVNKNFNILWVGKFDYRKQLELAIRTVSILAKKYSFVRLNIVGDTKHASYAHLLSIITKLKIEENIIWHGKIPNQHVHKLMQESDVFLFTSIDEGTPHVVLEAIQNNLPVICFDTCGQGDVVNDSIGIKIPLSNSKESPKDFANAISQLINNPHILQTFKSNCPNRQQELSWDHKINQILDLYHTLTNNDN